MATRVAANDIDPVTSSEIEKALKSIDVITEYNANASLPLSSRS